MCSIAEGRRAARFSPPESALARCPSFLSVSACAPFPEGLALVREGAVSQDAFPRSHRLLNATEFDRVFNEAEYRVGNDMLLILALRNNLGFNRLGMVVGKKKLPTAVARNKAKRIIRDGFRKQPGLAWGSDQGLDQEPGQGLDMVVLLRGSPDDGQFNSVLRAALANAFRRLAGRMNKVKMSK